MTHHPHEVTHGDHPIRLSSAACPWLYSQVSDRSLKTKFDTATNCPDEMLFSFMVPLLPYILEDRIGVDAAETQRLISAFLVEGALVSIASGPSIGDISDRAKSKKLVLLALLVLTLVSTLCLSIATSCKSSNHKMPLTIHILMR